MAKEESAKTAKTKRPTAKKRDLQNSKKRLQNKAFKSQVRTAIRNFEGALPEKDATKISAALKDIYGLMDKGVKRGVFKLNKASRTKSRLAARAKV
jgi:small subunit ribosomal protein S20